MSEKFMISGVRRTDHGADVEVEVRGGWVRWHLLSDAMRKATTDTPVFGAYLLERMPNARDPWISTPFHVTDFDKFDPSFGKQNNDGDGDDFGLGDAGDFDYGDDGGGGGDGDGDGSEQEAPEQEPVEPAESETESETESESDGDGDGDLEWCVLGVKTENPDDRAEALLTDVVPPIVTPIVTDAVSKLAEKFANVIGEVKSELMLEIAQAVLAEATDRADADIVLDAKTVSMIESLERKFERKIKAARGESGIFKIEVTVGSKVEIKEGLYHSAFPTLLRMIGAGMHVYLPGPPGTGKSHMAEQVANTLGWKFGAISLGPTTPESRLWGGMDANGHFHEPLLIQCLRYAQDNPEHGAIFCLDEMDNGHSGIIATLNSLMANGWVTAPNGDIIRVGANFSFIACANTYGTGPTAEFSGRNKLDAATLDRFQYVPVPTDLNVESTMVNAWLEPLDDGARIAEDWLAAWRTARKNAADNGLKVFVTMRGAINGARLLRAGFDIEETFAVVLGNKLPADQLTKISPF